MRKGSYKAKIVQSESNAKTKVKQKRKPGIPGEPWELGELGQSQEPMGTRVNRGEPGGNPTKRHPVTKHSEQPRGKPGVVAVLGILIS